MILKTPFGRTMWAHLKTATVFSQTGQQTAPTAENPGHYETLLVLDPSDEDTAKFLQGLDVACREAAEQQGAGQMRDPLYSLSDDVDENKEPTGMKRIKLRIAAGGEKQGRRWERSVKFFDHNGEVFSPEAELANGSIIRCSFEPRAYKNMGVIGVSLRLRAVQVKDAKYYTPAGSDDDFAGESVESESFEF